jgi:hypothetical protein
VTEIRKEETRRWRSKDDFREVRDETLLSVVDDTGKRDRE